LEQQSKAEKGLKSIEFGFDIRISVWSLPGSLLPGQVYIYMKNKLLDIVHDIKSIKQRI
jgi:hypothetical protein